MTTIAGVLIFAMFGAGSVGGVLAFAIVYGTFAGGCEHLFFSHYCMLDGYFTLR
jgi:hypothetical protein